MSWLSKNYEKAALGGAVVVALGLAVLGFSKYSGVDEAFPPPLKGDGPNDTAVREADRINQALASMERDPKWDQAQDDGRPVDMFTGIPLFVSSTSNDPVDPYRGAPIHAPIPNSWWIENRIDPGYADSPDRDPDQDGFSNLAEFQAKTDPNDPKDFPPLIAKLMYVKDDSLGWVLIPSYGSEDGSFPIKYEDTQRRTNKAGATDMVAPGDLFFAKDPMKNRFKLLGSEKRKEMNPNVNIEMEVTIIQIEDQRPNKKGTVYEFPAPLSPARKNEYLHYDRTAVLSLEALGLEGQEFKVEENTRFALPQDSAKKDYLLKTVTPESIEVEHTGADGTTKTYTIPKGGLPQMEP